MRVIRGLHNLRRQHRGCVATIGTFDGVHLGHQVVFRHLLQHGADLGLPATVITFEPQPQEYFAPRVAPARLTRLREKLQALRDSGIEQVVVLEFGPKLAAMEAREFVRELLVTGLATRLLMVGDDFRFGRGRAGNYQLLEVMGLQYGFEVRNLNTVTQGNLRVSSTRIREALTLGDFRRAEALLGRPYSICGRVAHGAERGRVIGFPTANLDLHRRFSPLRGVFAVRVRGLGEQARPGVANVGTRPTLSGDSQYLLEVHLFDFDEEIYGAHLQVEFHYWLRDERRFSSFEALRQQIGRDVTRARGLLGIASGAAS